MRYWDASALSPLLIAEEHSTWALEQALADDKIVTWVWSRVEVVSAVERRARALLLDQTQRRAALRRLEALSLHWHEITDVLAVRNLALGLMARHPLRAADSAQLAAASFFANNMPAQMRFVCIDARLSDAAEREGFIVETP